MAEIDNSVALKVKAPEGGGLDKLVQTVRELGALKAIGESKSQPATRTAFNQSASAFPDPDPSPAPQADVPLPRPRPTVVSTMPSVVDRALTPNESVGARWGGL